MSIFRKLFFFIFLFLNVNSSNVFSMEEGDLDFLYEKVSCCSEYEDYLAFLDQTGADDTHTSNEVAKNIVEEDEGLNGDDSRHKRLRYDSEPQRWVFVGPQKIYCPFEECDYETYQTDILDNHTYEEHVCVYQEGTFCCIGCLYGTKDEADFIRHCKNCKELRVSAIRCSVRGCHKSFLLEDSLIKHIQETHETPFVCRYKDCFKGYKSNNDLDAHIKSTHESFNDFTCPYCELVLASRISLEKHLKKSCRFVHPCKVKTMPCPNLCGKSYNSLAGLKGHLQLCNKVS